MADRRTTQRDANERNDLVAADVLCETGKIAVMNSSGYVEPGREATGLICVGVFAERVDNTGGANGAADIEITSGPGAFIFDDAADVRAIVKSDVHSLCYIVDDSTVSITPTGRSVCGMIYDVDDDGVHVQILSVPTTVAVIGAEQEEVRTALTGGGIVRHYEAPVAPVTTPDADGETTSVNLANALKSAYNTHRQDTDLHSAADSTNAVTTADATNLATAQTLLNEIKADFNAHVAATVHRPSTWTPATVTTADASDQSTANALANALKRAFNAHIASGLAD